MNTKLSQILAIKYHFLAVLIFGIASLTHAQEKRFLRRFI